MNPRPGIRGFLIAISIVLCSACASPQFYAQSTHGVTVMPDGRMGSLNQEGLAISALKVRTPYGLSNKITTFHVTLINQTDHPIDFIPKQYLLLDQNNHQYLALTKPDLSEAANSRIRYGGSISYGFGYGYGYPFHRFSYYAYPYWYDAPYYRSYSYQGLLAKALPIHPITIQPHALVEGYIYFAVSPRTLKRVRLQITRFSVPPGPDSNSREIPYSIEFVVVQ